MSLIEKLMYKFGYIKISGHLRLIKDAEKEAFYAGLQSANEVATSKDSESAPSPKKKPNKRKPTIKTK